MGVNRIRFNGILLEIEDTTARQQSSQAVAKANSAITKATSAQSTANSANKTATQASQTASGAVQTAKSVENKVNELAGVIDALPSWSYSNKTLILS